MRFQTKRYYRIEAGAESPNGPDLRATLLRMGTMDRRIKVGSRRGTTWVATIALERADSGGTTCIVRPQFEEIVLASRLIGRRHMSRRQNTVIPAIITSPLLSAIGGGSSRVEHATGYTSGGGGFQRILEQRRKGGEGEGVA
ncbi:hypothetical protein V1477_019842 [Vespula maculifrons]|uniref:Uncharacterized protein n=1 Tax=Vespula maculifrons TaxID=7453 RepID=A0ABD2AK79_VESMC